MPKYLLEIEAGLGTSSVDRTTWADSPSPMSDYNMMAYWGTARLFFAQVNRFRLGAEAGHNMFWWYTIQRSTGSGFAYDTYESRATRISAVARAALGPRGSVDLAPGLYMFGNGGTLLGISGALGYHFPASPRVSIPVKIRTDLVLGDATLIAFGTNVGVSIRF